MDDYETVDLSSFANAGREILGGVRQPEIGDVNLRGLPFRIGDSTDGERTFVGFGDGREPSRCE